MTAETFIDENLPRWLEPVTVESDADRVAVFRGASTSMAAELDSHVMAAVDAAFGILNDEARAWIASHVQRQNDAFVMGGKDELQRVLAAAAVAGRIASATDRQAVLAALAVLSAEFSGRQATIPELGDLARTRIKEMGQLARARARALPTIAAELPSLPRTRKPDEETGAAVSPDTLAGDLGTHAKAIRQLASAADQVLGDMSARQAALDEEVEMLWWVIRARDEAGRSWQERAPVDRAVAAAVEIADRTRVIPGPPSAAALLGRVLGTDAADEVTVAEVAVQCSTLGLDERGALQHRLLPVLTAAATARKLQGDNEDQIWQAAFEREWSVDLARSTSIENGAAQVYRELQMLRLLDQ